MKLDEVANSRNDEFYTPNYAIKPILKYIPKNTKVWCPFDTEHSNFVKLISKTNEVIFSHLNDGNDFFTFEPKEYDIIVSNPPYSIKGEVFKRLFLLEKPFAMLVGVVGLFESDFRFDLFSSNEFEVMYFNRRISYYKNHFDQKSSLNPPFSSVYLCSRLLPKQIVFEKINKKAL